MAIESHYLRKKIKYHLTSLEKYTSLLDIPDGSEDEYYSAVEIKIIEICSLMRKLDDLGKMPENSLTGNLIQANTFHSHGPDSQRAYADMEIEYDLGNPVATSLSLRTICNLVIHSYVLQAAGNEDRVFTSIYATSDFTQFRGLYLIDLDKLIEGFRSVVNLYPSEVSAYYDLTQRRWIHHRM